jgi:hypothetical protein
MVGTNVVVIVHAAPAASELPQLFVWLKFALGVIVNASGSVLRLVTVKVRVALVVPMATLPKDRDVGVTVTGALPVPCTLAVCGPSRALSFTVTTPVRTPVVVGQKVTVMTQLPRGFSELGQLFVCVKSPLTEMSFTINTTVPVFLRVKVRVVLALPTATVPKLRDVGESVATWAVAAGSVAAKDAKAKSRDKTARRGQKEHCCFIRSSQRAK